MKFVYTVLEIDLTGPSFYLGTFSRVEFAVEAARRYLDAVHLYIIGDEHAHGKEFATYQAVETHLASQPTITLCGEGEEGTVILFMQELDLPRG